MGMKNEIVPGRNNLLSKILIPFKLISNFADRGRSIYTSKQFSFLRAKVTVDSSRNYVNIQRCFLTKNKRRRFKIKPNG